MLFHFDLIFEGNGKGWKENADLSSFNLSVLPSRQSILNLVFLCLYLSFLPIILLVKQYFRKLFEVSIVQ